ncbi:LysR substrate binding domain protein [compost metagenome]
MYIAKPQTAASSGETLLHLARNGVGIACLSDFMTKQDRAEGSLVQVLAGATTDVRESIHAVYYRNTQLSQRAQVFVQFLKTKMKSS